MVATRNANPMRKDKQMATKKTTTKKAPKPAATKAKAKKPAGEHAKKLSQIDAAIRVLADAGEPMGCKAMVEAMQTKGLWSSPGGKTPEATLYSSILRDIRKGKDARFVKADRGTFALANGK
jgi:hypothetical protein